MTSQKDQIQSLIADIEEVLASTTPRTAWIRASDTQRQRQALARAQDYLMSLQQQADASDKQEPMAPGVSGIFSSLSAAQSSPSFSQSTSQVGASASEDLAGSTDSADSAEDVLQALLTEMKFLRSSALEPLRLEMNGLREQRDRLRQEIEGLDEARAMLSQSSANDELLGEANASDEQLSVGSASSEAGSVVNEEQLNQFLAALMERLQERLSTQVTQTLSQIESDHASVVARLSAATEAAATEAEVLQLRPRSQGSTLGDQAQSDQSDQSDQIEEIRQLQSRSDQLLVNIESTLQGMYETLQRNIDSYQFSLNEGIENMHSLGRQGEVIVRSLVDHLTQQLGQSAPPEPAFYPPRLAEASSTESPPATSTVTEPTDTVASLDDILPEAASEETAEDAVSATSDTTSNITGEANSDELQPEDCIQADGVIDLDLLKLDIERSDEDDALTIDDLMVDSAIADAQMTASEVEDLAIEAKVTPTADAAYLADLTIDDLTTDTSDEALDEAPSLADSSGEPEGDSALIFQSADETELADILPDFGESADEPEPAAELTEDSPKDSTEGSAVDLTEESAVDLAEKVDEETASAPLEDTLTEEDMAAILAAAALGTAVTADAERAIAPDLLVPDVPKSDVSEFNPSTVQEEPIQEEPVQEKPLESLSASLDVSTVVQNDISSEEEALGDLAAELEANNLAAERIARESVRDGLNALPSDLASASKEEPAVAPPAPPPEVLPEILTDDVQPLESSMIPDLPEALTEEPPVEEMEEVLLEETHIEEVEEVHAEEGLPEEADTEGPMAIEPPLEKDFTEPDLTADLWDEDFSEPDSTDSPLTESLLNFDGGMEAIDLSTDDLLANPPTDLLLEPLPQADAEAISQPPLSVAPVVDSAGEEPSAAADFDDDLDFYRDQENAIDPVDEYLESLSNETTEASDGEVTGGEVTGGEVTEPDSESMDRAVEAAIADLRVTDEPIGLPEVPIISPPLPLPSPPADSDSAEERAGERITEEPAAKDTVKDEVDEARAASGDSGNNIDPADDQPSAWFLGIDIGTTGLSAVLINQLGDQVYPLCWNTDEDAQSARFRLPTVLQIDAQTGAAGAVGMVALQQGDRLLRNIKPLLKVGIPRSTGEPLIQWSDRQRLPLLSLQAALTDLLKPLSAGQSASSLGVQAVGIESKGLRRALSNLRGVIVGYPNNWPDTYCFNVREAVLAAGIVAKPDQVFFVEEVIAALLSALPDPKAAPEDLDDQQPGLYNCNWEGGTVVISAGATLTEAAIADLPAELDQLIYRDFALRSFAYAGDSLDQDIVCQLLHLPTQAKLEASTADVLTADGWQSLGLDRLNLPHAGEADRAKRHRLRQRLNDSALGREAIAAARRIKLVLQEETQCEIALADQSWVVKRKDLETKVFLPYIQRVNRQVNGLLSQKGLAAQAVKQVVCTGGSAALGAIARWLRQKFPNATIIQDTYSGEYSNSCSRVAYGLANLCHYPHVLDTHRHQYNDYFLLLELLRVLPDQPLPAGGILHLLEQRGVNTQACQSHILALIEGHLPPGLIPTEGDRPMISAQSPEIGTYQMLAELPLFRKQGGQIYIADPQQGERLRHHLETLLATKAQTLQAPLTAELTAEVSA
ncbi:MAG: hypothetical protein WBA76_08505 [Phormidesmis sp.]